MLEEENPGCFDNPDKTFIDMYMKSGLYITEIVKRLYRSERIKEIYPDDTERLQHIFEKQVYGLAPTEIIYRIALRFILGFNDDICMRKNKYIIELTSKECHLCLIAMMNFKNSVLAQGIDTFDIDKLIKLLSKMRGAI